MIICGYPGIGKSTLAKNDKDHRYIDLESSNFYDKSTGERPENWHVYYCQIAEDLSRQGYIVLVSCHDEVRKWLENSKEQVVVIVPCKNLKEEWGEKLLKRCEDSKNPKDTRAYDKHMEKFEKNLDDIENGNLMIASIISMKYDLKSLIDHVSLWVSE